MGQQAFIKKEKDFIFVSVRTSLLCIVVELAGGGAVAVAVGKNDR